MYAPKAYCRPALVIPSKPTGNTRSRHRENQLLSYMKGCIYIVAIVRKPPTSIKKDY